MAARLTWKFPLQQDFMHRIEALFVTILALLIFIGSLTYYSYQLLLPLIYTALFLVVYVFAAHLVRIIRRAEEHYFAHPTHLEIRRKSRTTRSSVKVPWKTVAHHKLDHFFLGGYLLTKDKKKHALFFSTRKELDAFEHFVKRVLKKKR